MADDLLLAQYPRQAVVRDRNFSALLAWAGYTATLPIPADKPDEEWVRERIVAERIPTNTNGYVEQTMSYFMQDPVVQTNIRQFLSQWNDEATEASLSQQNADIIGTFMPRFSAATVAAVDVEAWYAANGWPSAPPP